MMTDRKSGQASRAGWGYADAWLMLGLFAAAVVILGKDIDQGALADADSAAHVMDGVLIHDWIAAGPAAWSSPMAFAREQYAHYPTLGIGQHYPPGFAIVEAGFFAVFGISPTTARLCVVFFAAAAAIGTFVFLREIAGRATAVLAALVLLAFPSTTLWGRQTMLEIPTMAALVWGAVGFVYYLRQPGRGRLAFLLLVCLSAILFKQTAVFLVCAVGMALVFLSVRGQVAMMHAAIATVVGAGALAATWFTLDDACMKTVSGYSSFSDPWSFLALSFYLRATPYLTGTWILIPAVFGGVLGFWKLRGVQWLLIAWTLVAYIMVTTADLKVARFFYVGVLPIAVWAGVGLAQLCEWASRVRMRPVLATAFAATLVGFAFQRPVRVTPDYAPIVEAHRNELGAGPVLFSGLRDGDFIFAVRQHLAWRTGLVVRGSKLLYTCTAGPDLDLVSYADDEAHLAEVMRRYAFEHVFVERENVVGTKHDAWLRSYLGQSGDYRLIASHTFPEAQRQCRMATTVDVYALAAPMTRTTDHLDIPMPRTGQPIRVSLAPKATTTDGPS